MLQLLHTQAEAHDGRSKQRESILTRKPSLLLMRKHSKDTFLFFLSYLYYFRAMQKKAVRKGQRDGMMLFCIEMVTSQLQ